MPIIILFLGMVLVIYAAKRIYGGMWGKKLKVTIEFQKEAVTEGENALLTELVRNEKKLPIPLLHVKFQTDRALDFMQEQNVVVSDKTYKNDIFSLMGYQQIKRNIIFNCKKRGIYSIEKVEMVAGFLFFDAISYESAAVSATMTVYPRTVDVEGMDAIVKGMAYASERKSRLLVDPFSFAGIREYRFGDAMKDINWKASARMGGLAVNIREKTAGQPVCIILNLEHPYRFSEDILEDGIRVAVTLAGELIREGLLVGLICNYDELLQDRAEGIEELNLRMARLELGKKCRSFAELVDIIIPQIREDVCYCIISPDCNESMQNAAEQLAMAAGEAWMIRQCVEDEYRVIHSQRLKVLERQVIR